MLPKPHKDPTKLENQRYIALLSVMGKLYKRLIKNRMNWIVETKPFLPLFQWGFCKGLSTANNFALLQCDTLYSLQNYKIMIVVFMDVKSAFYVASDRHILDGLISLGIKGPLIAVCYDHLCERAAQVKAGNCLSHIHVKSKRGVPQGSALGPISII